MQVEYVPYLTLSGRRGCVKRPGVGPRFQIRMLFYQFLFQGAGILLTKPKSWCWLLAARCARLIGGMGR